MNRIRIRGRVVGGFLLLFALFSTVQAQEKELEKPPENVIVVSSNGTELFRDLLFSKGFEPLDRLERLNERPDKTILVIFGSTRLLDRDFDRIRAFISSGGNILICSDRRSENGLSNLFNIGIVGTKLQAGKAKDGYFDDVDLPYLQPIFNAEWRRDDRSPSKIFLGAIAPLGAGGAGIATNVPSTLRHGPPFANANHTIEELAGFPVGSRFRTKTREFDPAQDFAALGGRFGRGHYLILSDQEIFSNALMVQSEANLNFASATMSWLREGLPVARDRCLFIEDNQIQTRFELSPEIPDIVKWNYFLDRVANQAIQKLEEKDTFNKMILGEDKGRLRYVVRGLLFSLLAMVAMYGVRWMWGRRHRTDRSLAVASAVIGRIPSGGALQQRHEAMLESGNLFEAYRSRIRERFLTIGGGPDADGKPPRIEVEESVEDQRATRKRVLDLWDVAFGGKTISVKAQDWDAANARLRRVLKESLDGRWRFEGAASTTD